MSIYEKRRNAIYDWMAEEGIALVMIEDFERHRDAALRWLTGQPGDALLFLSIDKKSLLVPWDQNLAMLFAQVDMIVPYTNFDRKKINALAGALDLLKTNAGSRIEIPAVTSYPDFLDFIEAMPDYDIICRKNGIVPLLQKLRAVKDEEEIKIYRKIGALTCEITDMIENQVRKGKIKTEIDAALFIDTECRKRGCEGTGFQTIAAGPERSFGIHAFPSYTAGNFIGDGFSILDYGIKYAGYTGDVTLTFTSGTLTKQQEKIISLVEKAYQTAVLMCHPGIPARDIAQTIDSIFERSKKIMSHGLGHGIGLEAHEYPVINSWKENNWILEPGMIFTIEPGFYDPLYGGCRLENDVLILKQGHEILTNSRIIRL